MEKCAVFHCVTLPIKRFYSFYFSFKKAYLFLRVCLFVCVLFFPQPRLFVVLPHLLSVLSIFFPYFVFLDVIKQRFMINASRYSMYVLGLLARTDCCCCCCCGCCYCCLIFLIVLTIGFWIVYFLFQLWCVFTLSIHLRLSSPIYFRYLLICCLTFLAGLLAPPLRLFCLLVYFFGC